ncbi:MAG: terminase large subunit domain-containing protein [Pseudonocardia sp.]
MTTTTAESGAVDVALFAEAVLGQPLWPHQLDLARSPARYRVMCAGRQVGKSTLLATIALHEAATRRDTLVLLVSAGETASRRLLAEAASLATRSPLLRGSVLDEGAALLTLSNGSRVISVPASARQIRGWPVDLLILDEAGFVDTAIWRSAEPSIIARPGSRVILSSSPWGGADHFFRVLWSRGMDRPDEQVASWHWPSSTSPLVDQALLEQIRKRESADYFEREFLAKWTDESGAFFTEAEIMRGVADYELLAPQDVPSRTLGGRWAAPAVGGVDWGVQRDQNALVLLSALNPIDTGDGRWRIYIPWMRAEHGWSWSDFIDYICDTAERYHLWVIASETNGVGAYPTDDLQNRLYYGRGLDSCVTGVWTDARRKQSAFGTVKALLQSDRLVLPRHPALLKELRSLEFEQTVGGTIRISVPERGGGHDDLAMALSQAVSCIDPRMLYDLRSDRHCVPAADPELWVTTGTGVRFPRQPLPWLQTGWMRAAAGREKGEVW